MAADRRSCDRWQSSSPLVCVVAAVTTAQVVVLVRVYVSIAVINKHALFCIATVARVNTLQRNVGKSQGI